MRRSDSAMARRIGDEVVILDVPSGHYFSLNDVGALVWDLLEHEVETAAIVDAVVAAFVVERSTAEADVETLLTELVDTGLVEE